MSDVINIYDIFTEMYTVYQYLEHTKIHVGRPEREGLCLDTT